MKQLVPFQIDDNTVIYIESSDDVQNLAPPTRPVPTGEVTRGELRLDAKGPTETMARQATQAFHSMENTLRGYAKGAINAFRDLGGANVDKVTLEFGVNVGGEAGVPYVTKGTAECSLKITVECSFPANAPSSTPTSP